MAHRPPSPRLLQRALIPPLALCVVAFCHSLRVVNHAQSPWKGGGFGMFSTVDKVGARFLRVYLTTPYGEFPVETPARLEKRARQLRAAPNQRDARRLALHLAAQNWGLRHQVWDLVSQKQQSTHLDPSDLQTPASPPTDWKMVRGQRSPVTCLAARPGHATSQLEVLGVRVEVWRCQYESTTQRLIATPVLSAKANLEQTAHAGGPVDE